jgi:hypothetical protein
MSKESGSNLPAIFLMLRVKTGSRQVTLKACGRIRVFVWGAKAGSRDKTQVIRRPCSGSSRESRKSRQTLVIRWPCFQSPACPDTFREGVPGSFPEDRRITSTTHSFVPSVERGPEATTPSRRPELASMRSTTSRSSQLSYGSLGRSWPPVSGSARRPTSSCERHQLLAVLTAQ